MSNGMTPADSAINVTLALARELETASPEEMKRIFREAAIAQGLATVDAMNPDILHETELAAHAPKRFSRTLSVDSKKVILEADSPGALQETEIQFHRDLLSAQQQEQSRDANGRFSGRPDIEDPVISQQVEGYLRRRNIDPADLQEVAGRGYVARWSTASNAFRQQHPEYQGGEENMRRLERH